MALTLPRSLEPLLTLTIKIVIGGAAFVIAYFVAVFIGVAVRAGEATFGAPAWLTMSAGWVEVIIWVGDLVVVGLFIARELVETIRTVIAEWRSPHGRTER